MKTVALSHYDNGRTVKGGTFMTRDQRAAMIEGEMFTLVDSQSEPFMRVWMDQVGNIDSEKT